VRVTVTGATGLVGRVLVGSLLARGEEVTVLTRDPDRASATLGASGLGPVHALRWEPNSEAAPVEALAGHDAVVHLAGENVARRWSASARRAIRDSRVLGTRNLLAGLERAGEPRLDQRPRVLISSSAIGYYGPHGEEPLDEDAPAGGGFLPQVCVEWEAAARGASLLGMRVVTPRLGIVLDRRGGALGRMLPAFRLGLGGAIAGGRQYMSWIHIEDVAGMICAALQDERWSGPVNATAPEPVTNREFTSVLARVLERPAVLPVPAPALRLLLGEMAEIIVTGARAVPAKPLVLGYEFNHPQLEPALRAALAPGSPSR
jgi:uncharacterized protein (TIGR01777 family)